MEILGMRIIKRPAAHIILTIILATLCGLAASSCTTINLPEGASPPQGGPANGEPAPAQTGGVPIINSFVASEYSIPLGGQAILEWNVANAEEVEITPGIGPTVLNGTQTVSPGQTTTYTLYAINHAGMVTSDVTIMVGGGGSPSPPGDTPTPPQVGVPLMPEELPPDRPDLWVGFVKDYAEPCEQDIGCTLITFVIVNSSTVDAGPFKVELYRGDTDEWKSTINVTGLLAGEKLEGRFENAYFWLLNCNQDRDKMLPIYIIVDADDVIDEANETNNRHDSWVRCSHLSAWDKPASP